MLTIPPIDFAMPNIDFEGVMRQLIETGKRTHQLWLTKDSMAFIARGREYRSEFHVNPSYEIQYSIKGDLNLHYRTPEGVKVAFVPEGSCLFQPPLVPHSSLSALGYLVKLIGSTGIVQTAITSCMKKHMP